MVQLSLPNLFSDNGYNEEHALDDDYKGGLMGGEEFDHDKETGSLLSSGASLVKELHGCGRTADCTRGAPPRAGELETVATPPLELTVVVPSGFQPGLPITVPGPHGDLQLDAPSDAVPGARLVFMLSPLPDFQISVPAGVKGGMVMHFETSAGDRIAIHVPEGLLCGDSFPVTPPALMVKVPAGATAGDSVVFQAKAPNLADSVWKSVDGEWFRATIPVASTCGYFAARLPKPKEPVPKTWHEELHAAFFGF